MSSKKRSVVKEPCVKRVKRGPEPEHLEVRWKRAKGEIVRSLEKLQALKTELEESEEKHTELSWKHIEDFLAGAVYTADGSKEKGPIATRVRVCLNHLRAFLDDSFKQPASGASIITFNDDCVKGTPPINCVTCDWKLNFVGSRNLNDAWVTCEKSETFGPQLVFYDSPRGAPFGGLPNTISIRFGSSMCTACEVLIAAVIITTFQFNCVYPDVYHNEDVVSESSDTELQARRLVRNAHLDNVLFSHLLYTCGGLA